MAQLLRRSNRLGPCGSGLAVVAGGGSRSSLGVITRMFQKNDEVVRMDIGFEPEAAVSGPVLLQTDDDAFLTFNAVRMTFDGRRDTAGTGVIEFERCGITKFGYPNDEALGGHPLYKRGLAAC